MMFSDSYENEALATVLEAVRRGWTVQFEPHAGVDGEQLVSIRAFRKTEYGVVCEPQVTPAATCIAKIHLVFDKASAQ